jgi:hypothetical protein
MLGPEIALRFLLPGGPHLFAIRHVATGIFFAVPSSMVSTLSKKSTPFSDWID